MPNKDHLFDPSRNPLSRGDYRPSEYKIDKVDMYINLDDSDAEVSSKIAVKRNPDLSDLGGPLVLDGENLILKSLKIIENGKSRDLDKQEFFVTDKNLVIKRPPEGSFELEIVTGINPEKNTKLEGIYKAGDIICSQCEAQGFRRITYFLDRPDNLAVFDVTLEANKKQYPVMLSNGNGDYRSTKDLGNGRHSVTWSDPHPKPSYLFATVAGDMKVLEDKFTTMSGKEVDLRIFVQPGYEDKISWAMESIKKSMKWDEDTYGREYDLDCFHVVATDKFNMGAMENKGLNVFNVSLLVGDSEISTDARLTAIEAVIGHEYFHNWTGNRVTVSDWFELTLKEGLTVLRDRQFTSDMHSEAIQTISDATELKAGQYIEDAGPTSHPIRPERVEEFDNIYTSTIYTKGSHVLGMMKTILGDKMWRSAMDNYFDKFDGQAVTCEDFIANMEDVSGIDLKQFRKWYSQSGTPEISYEGKYDAKAKTYSLTLTQNNTSTSDQKQKENLHLPIRVGLIGHSGKDIAEKLLELKEKTQTFVFKDINENVVPSVLRGFSAPVKVTTEPTEEELMFRMANDSDPFNKYEATERLMLKTIYGLLDDHKAGKELKLSESILRAYETNLKNASEGDMAFSAKVLGLPGYSLIIQGLKTVDPDAIEHVTKFIQKTLAEKFEGTFEEVYKATTSPNGEVYNVVPKQVGRRQLRNLSLARLSRLETSEVLKMAEDQYNQSTNMTEKFGALAILADMKDKKASEKALDNFYNKYKDNNNVVDMWLSLKAGLDVENPVAHVKELMAHEAFEFTNPNKVRSVIGGFIAGNRTAFHAKNGSGYKFLTDMIVKLNSINPRTAARFVGVFGEFKRFDEDRQKLMVMQLERIMATPDLDKGIKEIAGKALESAKPKKEDSAGKKLDKGAQERKRA